MCSVATFDRIQSIAIKFHECNNASKQLIQKSFGSIIKNSF